jgi:hypothetical protein
LQEGSPLTAVIMRVGFSPSRPHAVGWVHTEPVTGAELCDVAPELLTLVGPIVMNPEINPIVVDANGQVGFSFAQVKPVSITTVA